MPATDNTEDEKLFHSNRAFQRTVPLSSSATRCKAFQPMNRLWPDHGSKIQSNTPKKLGPAYSQRAQDAFADLDQSGADNTKEPQLNSEIIVTADEVPDEDTPSTPEPFRQWFTKYETNFVPHLGFCSVADGPFKGLIRSGPKKGQYLSGFISPCTAKIAEMEKAAVPIERLNNFWSSDSEAARYDDNISDSDDEELPKSCPQSTKSTVSSESESTSILIMRQLSQEEPPSNQELGILMSSSPSRSTIDPAHTPACHRSLQLAADRTAESPGITATTPKRQTEIHCHDVDLDITPNFERALSQVETPSTRSRSTQKTPAESSAALDNVQPAAFGRIVVKVPQLSPQKQAEYQKVPDNRSRHRRSPLKSFMEINRVHEDTQIASQDSGAAAIEHVLNASPSWLTNITEIGSKSPEHEQRTPYRLRSNAGTAPCHPIIESQPQPKYEADLTKNQDPTYQPSDSHSTSECSADEQTEHSKSEVKERARNPPGTSVKALLFARGDVPRPSQLLNSTLFKDPSVIDNESEIVRSTPIPAPSIPELLQRIKDTPSRERPESVPPSLKEAQSLIVSQLESNCPESILKSDTISHAAIGDAWSQTTKQRSKRKRNGGFNGPETGNDFSQRKKRKKPENSGSMKSTQQEHDKHHKVKKAQVENDESQESNAVPASNLQNIRASNKVCIH
jgi:hypothetical protein